MIMAMQKARKSLAKMKLGIAGPSGSGKTIGGILIAYGIVKAAHPELSESQLWEKICVVDTENGSGSLYVGEKFGRTKVGEYFTIPLSAPFESDKYTDALVECEENGIEAVVVDSFSHAWTGEGGFLDKQGSIAKRTGNSYTAWRDVTPKYCRLWDKILQCNMHVVLTMRSKTEYVIEENEKGKKVPKKVGTAPEMRAGAEYEVTTFFDVDLDHMATTTKDRTNRFKDNFFQITEDTGKEIYDWLSGGGVNEKAEEPVKSMRKASQENKQDDIPGTENITKEPINEPVTPVGDNSLEDLDDDLPFGNDPPRYNKDEALKMMDDIVSKIPASEKKELGKKIREITGSATANYRTYDDETLEKLWKYYKGVA